MAQRLYDNRRWRNAAHRYLQANPLCVMCMRMGRTTKAEVVDHIRPHKSDEVLFWDEANWQPLCKACHDSSKKHIENRGYSQAADVDGLPMDAGHPWNTGGND